MKLSTCFLILLFYSFFLSPNSAQSNQHPEHIIHSEAFDEDRRIRVFLPNKYFKDSTELFTVVYFLDAQSDQLWNMATGNLDYLTRNSSVIPMIIVGIHSDKRGNDFAPPASKLQTHFEKEVFPLIEKEYRVNTFRTIVGHSWGGAFVGSTLFSEKRNLFDAYIGISPSFDYHDNVLFPKADSLLKETKRWGKYFYFSCGDIGIREVESEAGLSSMDSLLKIHAPETLAWKAKIFSETDHWSCVIPSYDDGLRSMSRHYFADQRTIQKIAPDGKGLRSKVDIFYQEREDLFGYAHRPSAKYLKFIADDFRDVGNYGLAIPIYLWALEYDPNNLMAHINLADTYDRANQHELAKLTFQKMLQLLEDQKVTVSERFYNNISTWAKEKIEGYN